MDRALVRDQTWSNNAIIAKYAGSSEQNREAIGLGQENCFILCCLFQINMISVEISAGLLRNLCRNLDENSSAINRVV